MWRKGGGGGGAGGGGGGGLGAAEAERLPPGARGALFRRLLPKLAPITGALSAVAAERADRGGPGAHGGTPAQVALNWTMCKGAVPIPGARSPDQVRGALGACGWRLTAAEIAELDAAVETSTRGGGQMVRNVFQTS